MRGALDSERTNRETPATPPSETEGGRRHRPGQQRRPGAAGVAARRRAPKPPAQPAAIPERTPDPEQLIVGRIGAAHGTSGEFRLTPIASHREQLEALKTIYLGEERESHQVRRVRFHNNDIVVKVADFHDADDVVSRKGWLVRIDTADAIPLPEGEYYHYQLVGLDVFDEAGRPLGRLAQIIETGANDVYVVVGPNGEILLPAIASVIREVDVAGRRMVVAPPEYY